MLVLRNLAKGAVQTTDSGTYILDIRDKANLHALLIEFTATNGAGAVVSNLIDDIDTIRITKNGSEDVVVGSGNALRAVAHDCGVSFTSETNVKTAAATQIASVPILFGRDLKDPNHYLQTANIDSLQLRIDYSLTVGATAFVTATLAISVTAVYNYDTALADYRGYYRTRVVDSFTAAASGDKKVAIPTGQALSSVHIARTAYGADVAAAITNVIYEANQGDRVFWNDTSARLKRMGNVLKGAETWNDTTAAVTALPDVISFFHDFMGVDASVIPANTYKYLELTATQGSAVAVQVLVRDVIA